MLQLSAIFLKKKKKKSLTHPKPNAPIHKNNAGKAIKAFSEAPAILCHIHFLSYSKHKNPNTLQAVICRRWFQWESLLQAF